MHPRDDLPDQPNPEHPDEPYQGGDGAGQGYPTTGTTYAPPSAQPENAEAAGEEAPWRPPDAGPTEDYDEPMSDRLGPPDRRDTVDATDTVDREDAVDTVDALDTRDRQDSRDTADTADTADIADAGADTTDTPDTARPTDAAGTTETAGTEAAVAAVPAPDAAAVPATPAVAVAAGELNLVDPQDGERLRLRWREVQAGFVDDPADAVRSAEDLIREVLQTVTARLSDRTDATQIRTGGRADTEQLRLTLRRYRSLFDRILG